MHYQTTLAGIDWHEIKARLAADDFDNGRTAEQLQRSFEHSAATVVAHASGLPVGTARALSDQCTELKVSPVEFRHASY